MALEEMKELVKKLNDYGYYYYVLDAPRISDKEYDELYDRLRYLEQNLNVVLPDSPTQRVGGEILAGFSSHSHLNPLLSLDKVKSTKDLVSWEIRLKRLLQEEHNLDYVVELKFDGLTINLTYENGILIQAATRGNGFIGEAILEQVKTIRSIPLTINFQGKCEVQGEGLMRFSVLEEYNKSADEQLKNARNAAAGALRNLNPKETAKRKLDAFFYNIGFSQGVSFSTHIDAIEFLRANRLPVSSYIKHCSNLEQVIAYLDYLEEERKTLDYAVDGVVVKVNDLKTREALGSTDKFPRWAVAYKFEAEEVTTVINDLLWNVGRTGKITPIALLEPADIGGVTVSRATLNNWDDILKKEVQLNSKVWLRRSNDVIPEIMGRVDGPVTDDEQEFVKPTLCPACGSILIEKGPNLFCENTLSCRPQLVSRMVHFASRDAMDIEGFSQKTAEVFHDKLKVVDIAGIYKVSYEQLIQLDGFKDKKTRNLLAAIEASKKPHLASFIYALGIDHVGKSTAKTLADAYESLQALVDSSSEELIQLPDIGEVVANSITQFFRDQRIRDSINSILDEGVVPSTATKSTAGQASNLKNKRFVITGKLRELTRNEAAKLIEKAGGIVSKSVSKSIDYVVIGADPGSKAGKAHELREKGQALNLQILDEEGFKALLRQG